ncbi:cation:proton antiporter [Micavibrio aeruginosavorus]|uniref:Sodium/hydrogen exchanger n=1 Tax=Micavibrio aeruginosavorus EPB TaxID=349215 RepID=M4VZC1_9BACT|nr:sodium:proton antiporter [Micavibrio aeruginosavorus]AGH98519.1 Sodium/hydrogen exchanger [Micavibrio aeruginosavorus EPB]
MHDVVGFQIVLIAVVSLIAQWTAWRLHVPAILFLLGFGFLLGPVTGLLQPENMMGDLLQPAISAAVAIILFEGSLQLRFRELREAGKAVRRVIFIGAPLGWALIAAGAHYIAGLQWAVAVPLGAMLVVTGPTVIMPMLRHARLNPRIGAVLKWEGIVNDSLGVILAILSYEYFVGQARGDALDTFFIEHGVMVLGIAVGSMAMAFGIARIFDRGWMPEYLKAPFILSAVLGLFFLCNMIIHESGLIAVTVLGMTLANIQTSSIDDIRRFKETITLLLVSGVFLLLTADLDVSVLADMSWRGILFVLILLFVIRPATMFLCLARANMTWREVVLAGLIAPRGVVCAAMAGVIGPLLIDAGFEDGEKILPIAFSVVVVSVILHSLMIKPLAKRLQLTTTESNGIIFVGSYPWSIQLAEILKGRNVPVMMVDSNWNVLKKARLANLPTYYGDLLSEETEFALEMNKYNTILAATYNPPYNSLVCEKFGHEFGRERMFQISSGRQEQHERRRMADIHHGRQWVSEALVLDKVWDDFRSGWKFRTMRVGKEANDDKLIVPDENENRIHIGMISKNGVVTFFTPDSNIRPVPKEGDVMIVFEKMDAE